MTEPRIELLEDLEAEFVRVAAEHERAPRRARLHGIARAPVRALALALGMLVLLGAGAYAVPPTRAAIDDFTGAIEEWLGGDDDDITSTFEGWFAVGGKAPGKPLGDDAPGWVRKERRLGRDTRLLAKRHGVGLYVTRVPPTETQGALMEFGLGARGIILGADPAGWSDDFVDHSVALLGASTFVAQGKGTLDEQGRIPLMGVTAPSVEQVTLSYETGPQLVETGIDGGFVLIADAWRPLEDLAAYDADGRELERVDLGHLDLSYHCKQEPGDCPAGYAGATVGRRACSGPGPATKGFTYDKVFQAHAKGRGFAPSTTEQWVAPDCSGRIRTVTHPLEFLDPKEKESEREQGSPELGQEARVSNQRFHPGELGGRSYEGCLPPTRELRADPDLLAKIFRKTRAVCSDQVPLNAKTFEYAVSVLFQAGSSAELRAALHDVVTNIGGVELIRETRDPLGRAATAVALDQDYAGRPERYELYFDPASSQPLTFTEKLREPQEWHDGLLLEYKVLAASGHVRRAGDRPARTTAATPLSHRRLIEALGREDGDSLLWLVLLVVAGGLALVALLAMRARRVH